MALLAASSLPAFAQDEAPQVEAGPVDDGAITVDGHLDEPAWQQAGVIQDLTQQSPHPGEPTPYHTKVLLLRGKHTLYIGLVCDDPDPSKIATHTLVRDGSQGTDDNVMFMLDTFGTKRFAYVFQVNASGAMADGLQSPTPAINSNNGVDYNWDGIWQAKVVQNEHGWTAEIAIDTRSLQFTNGLTRWGFNVSRNVPRDLLTLDWSGITLDSSVFQLQREGTLTGVQGLEQGNGLDFQPYGLAEIPDRQRHHQQHRLRPEVQLQPGAGGALHLPHRLRRSRSGPAADQHRPLPAVLPGEAPVLPAGFQPVQLQLQPGHQLHPLQFTQHRPGERPGSAARRGRETHRPVRSAAP